MSNARGKHKARGKQRNKRCKPRGVDSKGLRKARKHPLTTLEKALLGKGRVQAFEPLGIKSAWRGVGTVVVPFDKAQADENKRLYPHLFSDEQRGRKRAA